MLRHTSGIWYVVVFDLNLRLSGYFFPLLSHKLNDLIKLSIHNVAVKFLSLAVCDKGHHDIKLVS